MSDQDILNKIGVEQLRKAAANTPHKELKDFAENATKNIEQANSNMSYDDCFRAMQFNGDETIKFDDIIGCINRKIQKFGKECISRRFIEKFKDKFTKLSERGQYSKLDVLIMTEKLC